VFAGMSVGEDAFDLAVEHPFKLGATMQAAEQASGGKVSAYHDSIANDQIEQIKGVAQNARGTLTKIYGKMKDKILNSVPESFSTNFDDAIHSSYASAIEKGIGKIVVPLKSTEVDYITGQTVERVLGESKTLTGAEAIEHLAKNGLKNGARFELLSQAEMANAINGGAPLKDEMGYLATDPEAYGVLKGYFKDMGSFADSAMRSGKQAAADLLNFKKLASDRAWALQNMEKVRDIPGVRNVINQSRTAVDSAIHDGLKAAGVGGMFTEMNGTYSKLAEKFSPLLNANYQFEKSGNPKVYEALLNQFLARPGKNVTNKYAIDAAIDAASEHGLGTMAKEMSNSKLRIQIGQAAKAFNPLPSEAKKNIARGTAGLLLTSLAMGHPGVAAGVAATSALGSPMMAKTGVALTQAAFKGQQMLASLPKNQVAQFLSSPEAVTKYTTAILQSPMIQTQVGSALQSQIPGQGQ
jgi:hypothetical protein